MGKERKRKYARSSSRRYVAHSGEEPAPGGVPRSKEWRTSVPEGSASTRWANEYIKFVLILSNIPTNAHIGIGLLEAPQLGVELLSQKTRFPLLRERLVYSRRDLCANFDNGKLLRRHV